MWSQMHGDEWTATNALVDVFAFLLENPEGQLGNSILNNVTIYAIPMLNPDGAEKNRRRNAQGLDINRDVKLLATPEARILTSTQEKLKPEFALNLHDQNPRRTSARTNKIVSIALLVPPLDPDHTETANILEAKKLASVMADALNPHIAKHLARYNAEYMPTAFGEFFQKAGTKTILLETGGWKLDEESFLVKMNFVAILSACSAIADNSYQQFDASIYESLPLNNNDKDVFDILIRRALILNGVQQEPFLGDVGVDVQATFENGSSRLELVVTDLGDLSQYEGKSVFDAEGFLVVPGIMPKAPSNQIRKLDVQGQLNLEGPGEMSFFRLKAPAAIETEPHALLKNGLVSVTNEVK